jgi:hypothetical protein
MMPGMDFYTPIFSKIADSSLWDEPDFVVKVFITMLAKKDRDFVVRGNAYNIASWSKKTEAEALDALKILSSPDTKRLEPQPFDGRRIERVADGWLILNGKYYQDLMGTINRRANKALYEKGRRERKKGQPLAGEVVTVAAETNGASQHEVDALTTANLPAKLR